MDSLTQLVLGAAVGQAVLGKKEGNKAVLWGAIAGTIPDLDIFFGGMYDIVDKTAMHRGFSHSFVFAAFLSPLLGYIIYIIHKKNSTYQSWAKLIFLGMTTHVLLDCFTTWGTQVFWPIPYRVSFQNIFVVDPLYTIPFLICVVIVLFLKKSNKKRTLINNIGLIVSSVYMIITIGNKLAANQQFEAAYTLYPEEIIRYSSRPSPLNSILWTANAELKEGYLISYYSLFDESEITHKYIPRNKHLLNEFLEDEKLQKLFWLTKGYYSVEKISATEFHINDLRFGQMGAFENEHSDFVIKYILKIVNGELQFIEGPRPNPENPQKIIADLWDRIKGV